MAKRSASSVPPAAPSQEEKKLMVQLDEIFPHHSWDRLRAKIDVMPWEKASSACGNGLQNHEEEATRLYLKVLSEIDNLVSAETKYNNKKHNKLHDASVTNCHQIMIDKAKIEVKYGEDHVSFVHAMARLQTVVRDLERLRAETRKSASGRLVAMAVEGVPQTDGTIEDQKQAESLEQCWNNWSPLSDHGTSPECDPFMCEPLQAGSSEKYPDMYALELLVQETRKDIIRYKEIAADMEKIAASAFPEGRSPHEKIPLEQLNFRAENIDSARLSQLLDANPSELLQNLHSKFHEIANLGESLMELLKSTVHKWRNLEKRSNVTIQPEAELDGEIFTRFAKVLNTLSVWFVPPSKSGVCQEQDVDLLRELCSSWSSESFTALQKKVIDLEDDYIRSCIIVSLQPPSTRALENLKKNTGSNTPSEQEPSSTDKKKKKKEAGKSFGSKKQQGYSTKIRILGAEQFWYLNFHRSHISCVSESDLAAAKKRGDLHSKLNMEGNNLSWCEPEQSSGKKAKKGNIGEKEFTDVRISDHLRGSSIKNHEGFVRICYHLSVEVNQRLHHVQVLSLPFHFITGSNQLQKCLGTRLWYFGTSEDMYDGNFTVEEKLPVGRVIDLLDLRVRHVHKRGRFLREEEKDFLKDLLIVEDGFVSLDNFVKDGTVPKRNGEHAFCAWFQALVNMIETRWIRPWLDGAIYGLIDEDEACKLLTQPGKHVSCGTIVLRPGKKMLDKPNSQSPELALVMQTKYRFTFTDPEESIVMVKSITLEPAFIGNNGLHAAVTNVIEKLTKKVIAKHLIVPDEVLSVDFLARYQETKINVDEHYGVEVQCNTQKFVSVSREIMRRRTSQEEGGKKVKNPRRPSKSSGATTRRRDQKSPEESSGPAMEVDNSPAPIKVTSQGLPSLGQLSEGQRSIKSQRIVAVPLLTGGMAVKTNSARNSPVPHEVQCFDNLQGVIVDTSTIRKQIFQARFMTPSPKMETDSGLSSMSPSESDATSPKMEPSTLSLGADGQTTFVIPQLDGLQVTPPSSKFEHLSLQYVPGEEDCVIVSTGGLPKPSPTDTPKTNLLNIPKFLEEPESEESSTPHARKPSRGKQSMSHRHKKHTGKEKESKSGTEQAFHQPLVDLSQQAVLSEQILPDFQHQEVQNTFTFLADDDQQSVVTAQNEAELMAIMAALKNGSMDQNIIPIGQEQAGLNLCTLVQFDALESDEHLAEMLDPQDCQEGNKLDSGFGGDSLSPTTGVQNFHWVSKQ